jgi:hypothetical protein
MATTTSPATQQGLIKAIAAKYSGGYVGNYNFSLTGEQQSNWQLFLRIALKPEAWDSPDWGDTIRMLHDLSYTDSWTAEPQAKLYGTEEAEAV